MPQSPRAHPGKARRRRRRRPARGSKLFYVVLLLVALLVLSLHGLQRAPGFPAPGALLRRRRARHEVRGPARTEHLDPLSRRPALTTSAWATASCRLSSSASQTKGYEIDAAGARDAPARRPDPGGLRAALRRENAGRPAGRSTAATSSSSTSPIPSAPTRTSRRSRRSSCKSLLFIENRELLDDDLPDAQPGGRMDAARPGASARQFMKIVDRDYDAPGRQHARDADREIPPLAVGRHALDRSTS